MLILSTPQSGVLAMPYFITQYTDLQKPDPNDTTAVAAFHLTARDQSLTTSILSAGTFFGAIAAGDIADFIGRRMTIIAGCGVFSVGCILETASTGLAVMVVGRFIAGLGVGFISAIGTFQTFADIKSWTNLCSYLVHVRDCAPKGPRCPCIWIPILYYHWNSDCQWRSLRNQAKE